MLPDLMGWQVACPGWKQGDIPPCQKGKGAKQRANKRRSQKVTGMVNAKVGSSCWHAGSAPSPARQKEIHIQQAKGKAKAKRQRGSAARKASVWYACKGQRQATVRNKGCCVCVQSAARKACKGEGIWEKSGHTHTVTHYHCHQQSPSKGEGLAW